MIHCISLAHAQTQNDNSKYRTLQQRHAVIKTAELQVV